MQSANLVAETNPKMVSSAANMVDLPGHSVRDQHSSGFSWPNTHTQLAKFTNHLYSLYQKLASRCLAGTIGHLNFTFTNYSFLISVFIILLVLTFPHFYPSLVSVFMAISHIFLEFPQISPVFTSDFGGFFLSFQAITMAAVLRPELVLRSSALVFAMKKRGSSMGYMILWGIHILYNYIYIHIHIYIHNIYYIYTCIHICMYMYIDVLNLDILYHHCIGVWDIHIYIYIRIFIDGLEFWDINDTHDLSWSIMIYHDLSWSIMIYLPTYLPVYLSVYLSMYLCIYVLSMYLSMHRTIIDDSFRIWWLYLSNFPIYGFVWKWGKHMIPQWNLM